MKKVNKKRKFFLGGLDPVSATMGAISLGTQIYSGIKAKTDAKNARSRQFEDIKSSEREADRIALESVDTKGGNVEFYRKGGLHKLNSRKGLIPMGNNTYEVKGNKHEQGGTKIFDAEVEDGELIKLDEKGMSVLSDAESHFGYSPAKKATSSIDRGFNIDDSFDREFNKQESMKANKTKSKRFKLGGSNILDWNDIIYDQRDHQLENDLHNPPLMKSRQIIPNVNNKFDLAPIPDKQFTTNSQPRNSKSNTKFGRLSEIEPETYDPNQPKKDKFDISPFIDNAVNLAGTLLTPKTPLPIANKMVNLDTKIDVNPQMQEITEQERGINKYATSGLADANAAAALVQRNSNMSSANRNRIRSDAANTEAQLRNQETMINSQIQQGNNAKAEAYMLGDAERSKGIIENISQNAANLGDDLTKMANNKKVEKYQQQQLMYSLLEKGDTNAIASAIMLDSDTYAPVILQNYDKIINGDFPMDENLKNTINKTYSEQIRQMRKEGQDKLDRQTGRRNKFRNFINSGISTVETGVNNIRN